VSKQTRKNLLTVIDLGRAAFVVGSPRRMRCIEKLPAIKKIILPWDDVPHKLKRQVIDSVVSQGGRVGITTGIGTGERGTELYLLCSFWPMFVLCYASAYDDMDFSYHKAQA
jgi:hypothetical protein